MEKESEFIKYLLYVNNKKQNNANNNFQNMEIQKHSFTCPPVCHE